jgi:hypothetical protein
MSAQPSLAAAAAENFTRRREKSHELEPWSRVVLFLIPRVQQKDQQKARPL